MSTVICESHFCGIQARPFQKTQLVNQIHSRLVILLPMGILCMAFFLSVCTQILMVTYCTSQLQKYLQNYQFISSTFVLIIHIPFDSIFFGFATKLTRHCSRNISQCQVFICTLRCLSSEMYTSIRYSIPPTQTHKRCVHQQAII